MKEEVALFWVCGILVIIGIVLSTIVITVNIMHHEAVLQGVAEYKVIDAWGHTKFQYKK